MVQLTKEQKSKYKTMSRESCEKYCLKKHSKTSIIISIKSSWDRVDAEVFRSAENKVLGILRLSFDDIDMEDNEQHAMTSKDGEKIISFVNKWYNKADTIIVHCDGGISRSAGVAAAIMRVKEKADYPFFWSNTKHPNITCYLRTLEAFKYIPLKNENVIAEILGYKIYFYNDEVGFVHVNVKKYDEIASVYITSDHKCRIKYERFTDQNILQMILDTLTIISPKICEKWEECFGEIKFIDMEKKE